MVEEEDDSERYRGKRGLALYWEVMDKSAVNASY
jgi:hypothetical protein